MSGQFGGEDLSMGTVVQNLLEAFLLMIGELTAQIESIEKVLKGLRSLRHSI